MENFSLLLPILFGVLMFGLVILLLIYTLNYRLRCRWTYLSHEVVAEIKFGRAKLYVDGKLEDEIAADRMRVFTLRAFVDGKEIKVHVRFSGFRAKAEATAGGEPLTLIYAGK